MINDLNHLNEDFSIERILFHHFAKQKELYEMVQRKSLFPQDDIIVSYGKKVDLEDPPSSGLPWQPFVEAVTFELLEDEEMEVEELEAEAPCLCENKV